MEGYIQCIVTVNFLFQLVLVFPLVLNLLVYINFLFQFTFVLTLFKFISIHYHNKNNGKYKLTEIKKINYRIYNLHVAWV